MMEGLNPCRYVDMAGIMEVRTTSDDPEAEFEPMDMLEFENACGPGGGIPSDYCYKNMLTGEQNYFHCLSCACDLKSLKMLSSHINGKKHISRVIEKKRLDIGLPSKALAVAQIKDKKKPPPRLSPHVSLKERLKKSMDPIVGLEFVSEYKPPAPSSSSSSSKYPMYTCSLEGCSSAWGTSDDMFNHIINVKHQRSYFRLRFPEDGRIVGMTKNEILNKTLEYAAEHAEEGTFIVIEDEAKYLELANRPDTWSEKKAKLGLNPGGTWSNAWSVGRGKRPFAATAVSSVKNCDGSGDGLFLPFKPKLLSNSDKARILFKSLRDLAFEAARLAEQPTERQSLDKVSDLYAFIRTLQAKGASDIQTQPFDDLLRAFEKSKNAVLGHEAVRHKKDLGSIIETVDRALPIEDFEMPGSWRSHSSFEGRFREERTDGKGSQERFRSELLHFVHKVFGSSQRHLSKSNWESLAIKCVDQISKEESQYHEGSWELFQLTPEIEENVRPYLEKKIKKLVERKPPLLNTPGKL